MRISALTGLFACTLVLVGSQIRASAESLPDLSSSNVKTNAVRLISQANSSNGLETTDGGDSSDKKIKKKKTVITHVIAKNETLTDIAEKFKTSWRRIYDKNLKIDDPNVIQAGEKIIIPRKNEKLKHRDIVAKQSAVSSLRAKPAVSVVQYKGSVAGNGYVPGYCTWYVKNRRPDLPNNLGNAYSWVSNASAQGYATGSNPRVGAVGQQGNHVVYVESVNKDGTVTISEMNFKGRFVKSTRTVPASNFYYIY